MDARGKEDERGKHPAFESIPLSEIDKYMQAAKAEGKFVYIADMHGNCHHFFTYSAAYPPFEFGTEVKKVIVHKKQTPAEAAEATRKAMVMKMRTGAHMIFHMETLVPEMEKYDSPNFPIKDLIFKREKLMTDYKQIVKPDEDHDLAGNKGLFSMHSDFNLGILFNMSDPDTDDEIL